MLKNKLMMVLAVIGIVVSMVWAQGNGIGEIVGRWKSEMLDDGEGNRYYYLSVIKEDGTGGLFECVNSGNEFDNPANHPYYEIIDGKLYIRSKVENEEFPGVYELFDEKTFNVSALGEQNYYEIINGELHIYDEDMAFRDMEYSNGIISGVVVFTDGSEYPFPENVMLSENSFVVDGITYTKQVASVVKIWGCGDDGKTDETSNVIATLTDDGTLTISGTGDMTDWNSSSTPPWVSVNSNITTVVIEAGVTSIGSYAFSYCSGLTEITFEGDKPTFDDNIFSNISNNQLTLYYPCGNETWDGYSYSGVRIEPNHNFNELGVFVIPATCTTPAKHKAKCSICGKEHETHLLDGVAALGHDFSVFGEWDTTKVATPTEEGSRTRTVTCSRDKTHTAPNQTEVIARNSTAVAITDLHNNDSKSLFKSTIVSDKMEIILDEMHDVRFVVYDMTGNVVADGRGRTWDLRNSAGRFVANGSYLVVVEAMDRSGVKFRWSEKLGVKR